MQTNGDYIGGDSEKRTHCEITPLRANLEHPEAPILIKAGILIFFVVIGPKTLNSLC